MFDTYYNHHDHVQPEKNCKCSGVLHFNAPNCRCRAIHRRTHQLFRFFRFSFSSSSLICCSTANAQSKIACSSSLLLLQLSAIAVKKQVCVCNGLHIMTSFTQLPGLDCFATTTGVIYSYDPDSKPTLAQRWPNYGTVDVTLALGEQYWANVGPTMYRQHKFQVNLV